MEHLEGEDGTQSLLGRPQPETILGSHARNARVLQRDAQGEAMRELRQGVEGLGVDAIQADPDQAPRRQASLDEAIQPVSIQ